MSQAAVALVSDLQQSAYSALSFYILWGSCATLCKEIQQGDPLGPMLFCLTIQQMYTELRSCRTFIDRFWWHHTQGNDLAIIIHDLQTVERLCEEISLQVKHSKSELVCQDPVTIIESFCSMATGFHLTKPVHACNDPIGYLKSQMCVFGWKDKTDRETDYRGSMPKMPFCMGALSFSRRRGGPRWRWGAPMGGDASGRVPEGGNVLKSNLSNIISCDLGKLCGSKHPYL